MDREENKSTLPALGFFRLSLVRSRFAPAPEETLLGARAGGLFFGCADLTAAESRAEAKAVIASASASAATAIAQRQFLRGCHFMAAPNTK